MAEQQPKKKKHKLPYGAIAWGLVGTAALVRAFWNPERAVVKDGYTSACEGGANCSPYMVIDAAGGSGAVFSGARGKVIRVQGSSVWIVPNREAVVLEYTGGPNSQVMVREGQTVWQGQQIAAMPQVKFAVFRIDRTSGSFSYTPLSPAAWLASRGLRISAKKHSVTAEGDNWCEGGRKLQVPQRVGQCGIKLPDPSSVALLPISVTMG